MDSHFAFYLNETQFITPQLCVPSHFEHKILNLGKDVSFKNPYYAKDVCPYVFMNSPIKSLILNQISNSFIYKNQLEFLIINESVDLNYTNLYQVTIETAYEHKRL